MDTGNPQSNHLTFFTITWHTAALAGFSTKSALAVVVGTLDCNTADLTILNNQKRNLHYGTAVTVVVINFHDFRGERSLNTRALSFSLRMLDIS